jgi:hypothetical protein
MADQYGDNYFPVVYPKQTPTAFPADPPKPTLSRDIFIPLQVPAQAPETANKKF